MQELIEHLKLSAQVMRGTADRIEHGYGFDRDMLNKGRLLNDAAERNIQWAKELESK